MKQKLFWVSEAERDLICKIRCFKILGSTAGIKSRVEIIELKDIILELQYRDQKASLCHKCFLKPLKLATGH